MTPTTEQVDTAVALSTLASKLDQVAAKMRQHASGLILEWAMPETADALADALDEMARQVRLNRPTTVLLDTR